MREGNSDRRVADAVKKYAQKYPGKPHRVPLVAWKDGCKSHVSHMSEGDFFSSEQSVTNGNSPVKVDIK